MSKEQTLRIATYNIHKCRGMDARVRPERVAAVLADLGVDVVALQEVVRGKKDADQLVVIAKAMGAKHYRFGVTRQYRGADYGNAVISKFPIISHEAYDITASRREPRGCLRADIDIGGRHILRLFNAHLGTGLFERRKQAQMLVEKDLLSNPKFYGSRIVLGDFNEWTRGLTTKLLRAHLVSADLRPYMRRIKTYPGMIPFMHLDHIYFDPRFQLTNVELLRTRASKMASDHLPLIAEFKVAA
jgi:endonuclease/exonuclease/phosphatase family metal-dependent hydrolase